MQAVRKYRRKRFDSAESSDDLFEERALLLLDFNHDRTERTRTHIAMFNIITAAPNEAVIVSGFRGQRVVIGGCASVFSGGGQRSLPGALANEDPPVEMCKRTS